jgi:hypothetical protein
MCKRRPVDEPYWWRKDPSAGAFLAATRDQVIGQSSDALDTPRDLSEKARNEFLRPLDRAWNAGLKFVTDSPEQDCPGTSEMGSCVKSSCSLPPLISQLAMMQAFGVAG